jgi:hypothetical protein
LNRSPISIREAIAAKVKIAESRLGGTGRQLRTGARLFHKALDRKPRG